MMFFTLLVLTFAAYWLTRFITVGKFPLFAMPRDAFVERWGVYTDEKPFRAAGRNPFVWLFAGRYRPIRTYTEAGGEEARPLRTSVFMKSLAYLWECDWCMGAYISGLVVFMQDATIGLPMPLWMWLAVAGFVGLLRTLEPTPK